LLGNTDGGLRFGHSGDESERAHRERYRQPMSDKTSLSHAPPPWFRVQRAKRLTG
jgi:hypothetical protein